MWSSNVTPQWDDFIMNDNRFTKITGHPDDLLDALDLDDVSDIETLLIILFNRPISVEPLEGVDDVRMLA